jgi:hypothetical protein
MNNFVGFYSSLKHLVGDRKAQYTDYATVRVTGNGGLILGKTRDFCLLLSVWTSCGAPFSVQWGLFLMG